MEEYWPAPKTDAETIKRHADLIEGGGDAGSVARAWTDAGFDDETTARWLKARCFDAQAARAPAVDGATTGQAPKRTRHGSRHADTTGYKAPNGDLTPRQGAARCLSSR